MTFTTTSLMRLAVPVACAFAALGATAQPAPTFPNKPIRIVVPFPPGGPTDLLARLVGQRIGERLKTTVVVDNRPGANTIIGADAVAKAPPDGYTLLVAIDNTLVMNQYLYSKLPYDPIKDFEPIGKLAISPLIIQTNGSGPKTIDALVTQVKANPKSVSYGFGTFTTQLSGELLKQAIGKGMVDVTYKGSTGVVQGLLSNDVTFIIDGVTAGLPHIQKGTFQALAKLSSKNIPALPDLRSLSQSGVNMPDIDVWISLMAPKGTPKPIIDVLNREMLEALGTKEIEDKLVAAGLLADGSSPEALRTFIAREAARWKPVIEESGIKVE